MHYEPLLQVGPGQQMKDIFYNGTANERGFFQRAEPANDRFFLLLIIIFRELELEPGAGALNFSHAPGLLWFFNILLNLFFKNYVNIQYFNYNRKNE